jgi:hypothetical protein
MHKPVIELKDGMNKQLTELKENQIIRWMK